MLKLIKKLPLWMWLVLIVLTLFLVNQASSYFSQRSLFNQLLDNLREDQSRVIEIKEENDKKYEAEIVRLQEENALIKKELVSVRIEKERLRGKINELQTSREGIIIPSDPDGLVDDFRKMGFGSTERRKK